MKKRDEPIDKLQRMTACGEELFFSPGHGFAGSCYRPKGHKSRKHKAFVTFESQVTDVLENALLHEMHTVVVTWKDRKK